MPRRATPAAWRLVRHLLCLLLAGALGCDHELQRKYKRCTWLLEGRAFLLERFLSKLQVRRLRKVADLLFSAQGASGWEQNAVNDVFAALQVPMPELTELEESIANLTGIVPHSGETPLYLTRQLPGALPPGNFIHGIHHDKNYGERRTVTVLIYLSSGRSDEDGGHTLFPQIPRSKSFGAALRQSPDDAGGQDPVPYLQQTFEHGFHLGRRELLPHELAEKAEDIWDEQALQLAERECELALQGQNHALAVRPREGSAVVFHNEYPDGRPDLQVWHTACHPVGGPLRIAVQKFKEPPQPLEPQSSPKRRGRRRRRGQSADEL